MFVVEYAKAVNVPAFKLEEQILLRAFFNVAGSVTGEEPMVTSADFETYSKFFEMKPNFPALLELLQAPWFFGIMKSDEISTVLQGGNCLYLVRLSTTICSFVISFKHTQNVTNLTVSRESMDLPSLIKLFKDKKQIITRIATAFPTPQQQNEMRSKPWVCADEAKKPAAIYAALYNYNQVKKKKAGLVGGNAYHANFGSGNADHDDTTTALGSKVEEKK